MNKRQKKKFREKSHYKKYRIVTYYFLPYGNNNDLQIVQIHNGNGKIIKAQVLKNVQLVTMPTNKDDECNNKLEMEVEFTCNTYRSPQVDKMADYLKSKLPIGKGIYANIDSDETCNDTSS